MNNALITDEQRIVLLANGRESWKRGLRSGARGQAVHAGRRRDLAADRD